MNHVSRTIILLLTTFISWVSAFANNTVEGTITEGNVITRTYNVYDFNAISASTVCNINFVQTTDGTSSLQIRSTERQLAKMKVEVKNGVLCLNETRRKGDKDKVEVIITAPELNSVFSEGVGNFVIKNGLKTNVLKIKSSGVGSITINSLNCDNLIATLDGVGNIVVNGTAKDASFNLTGVGSIKAGNLKADKVKAFSQGIGEVRCYAIKSIDVSLQGIGSIYYSGNPEIKNLRRDGVGKIKQN